MRFVPARLAVAVLCLAAVGLAPAAADDPYVPVTPNEKVYFHCSSAQTSKVGNADTAAASWNTTAPTQSVTAGAGCGQADLGNGSVSGGGLRFADARFAGSYTGNLDQLNVRLDSIYASQGRAGGPATLTVKLKVDGVDVLGTAGKTVAVTPVPSSTRASEAFSFSVKGLNLLGEADNKTHAIELYVKAPVQAGVNAWVYDTTEVPGGVEFAPTALHGAVISR